MNIELIGYVMFFGLLFIVIMGFTIIGVELLTGNSKTITTDCYDRYQNKMNNITCEEKIHCGVISNIIDNQCMEDTNE